MDERIRRVVTTNDATGAAVVLLDGAAPNRAVRQGGRIASTVLWVTDRTPARFSPKQDRGDVKIGVAPPPGGTVFRIVDFAPVGGDGAEIDHAALMREMGLAPGAHGGRPPRHPFMHRTKTVDYAIVLAGEIDMLLDDSEVHLKAGEVVVQQGTNHAWVNRGKDPCRIAFVLIGAEEG